MICDKCEGRGKLRNNTSTSDTYTFGFIECDACSGSGRIMEEEPYIHKIITTEEKLYNPKYGDDRICKCGHPYYRHFDTYEDMRDVGCKYCDCHVFEEEEIANKTKNLFMNGLVICSCGGTVISNTGKVIYNHKENKVHCWICNKEYNSDYAYSMRKENTTVQLDQKEEDI